MKALIIGLLCFIGLMVLLAVVWPGGAAVWFQVGGFTFSARMVVSAVVATLLCWKVG